MQIYARFFLFNLLLTFCQTFHVQRLRLNHYPLGALKFDKKDFVTISINKPLGLDLEEAADGKDCGVVIAELTEGGNAAKTQRLARGMFLKYADNVDVGNMGFDEIIGIIKAVPEGKAVDLVFIYPNDVFNGPAILEVTMPITYDAQTGEAIRKVKQITCKKGQMLRDVLLDNRIDLYDMRGKATNCGGAGQCGTCVVRVSVAADDWTPLPTFEAKKLTKYDKSCRLSCNVIVEGDADIEIRPSPKTDSKLAPKSIF